MNRLWSPRLMVDLVEQVDERGLAISPTLPEGCKNLRIDIDGTICEFRRTPQIAARSSRTKLLNMAQK